MGLYAGFSMEDLGYPAYTPELGIPIDYSDGLSVFVSSFLNKSKEIVPVDTGNLRRSLQAEADDFDCECWTDCEYSQYVEYGTIYMSAQPYFEPALLFALNEAYPLWDDAYEEAMEEEEEMLEEMEEEEMENDMMSQESMTSSFAGGLGGIAGLLLGALVVGIVQGFINLVRGESGTTRFSEGSIRRTLGGDSEPGSLEDMREALISFIVITGEEII